MAEVALRGGSGASVAVEIEVRRSRFLCVLERVDTEAAARDVIERERRQHWDARHHCSAFVVGPDGPSQVVRSNDDGEPSGTAGAPMLTALRRAELIDTVAVVTRWFGGVLLGTGGLARAYSDAVDAAVEEARTRNMLVGREHRTLVQLTLPHVDAGRVESELRAKGSTVLAVEYADEAVLTLVGDENVDAIVASATGGTASAVPIGGEWVDVEL